MTIIWKSIVEDGEVEESRSLRILESGTGFLEERRRIAETGMRVCEESVSFRVRIEVVGGRESRVMSRGGLRRDLRVTVSVCGGPVGEVVHFWRGLGILGRMYWGFVSCGKGEEEGKRMEGDVRHCVLGRISGLRHGWVLSLWVLCRGFGGRLWRRRVRSW